MAQFAYEFDPHADNDDNIIQNEVQTFIGSASGYNVLIPNQAPFFDETALKVTHHNKTLTLGVDYYLTHKYFTGTVRTGKLMYSGIWIVNPALTGSFKITYRTLGWKFPVARSVINSYLTTRLSDPSLASWEEVIDEDPYFPVVDTKFDRDAFNDHLDLAGAFDDIADALTSKDATKNDLYTLLDYWLGALEDTIDESTVVTHGKDYNNPHGDQWFDADALHEDGIAANANKVFSKTISELTSYINAQGITQSDLDQYALLGGNNTFTGDFILKDGVASMQLTNEAANKVYSTLNMSNGYLSFSTLTHTIIQADSQENSPGTAVNIKAGESIIEVRSSGASQDDRQLFLNGKELIHEGNLDDILPDGGTYVIDLETYDTESLSFEGKGVSGNPLKADATKEQATTSNSGLAKGTTSITSSSKTLVAYSKATSDVDALRAGKIPQTRKVNGKTLDKDIVLDKGDLGLENVQNIPDSEYPVTAAQTALLANKSPDDHTHTFDELGVVHATESAYGTVILAESATSGDDDKAISGPDLLDLDSLVNDLESTVSNSLPDDVIDITQYGGNNYLPVPVLGDFGAAGKLSTDEGAAIMIEDNGDFVMLRNGADMNSSGVYYVTGDIGADDAITNVVATSTPYAPSYLPDGHRVVRVYRNNDDLMTMAVEVTETGTEYLALVLLNKTLDSSKHDGCIINSDIEMTDIDIYRHWPLLIDDTVYILGLKVNEGGYQFGFSVYSAPVSQCTGNAEVTFDRLDLTGTSLLGESVSGQLLKLVENGTSPQGGDDISMIQISATDTRSGGPAHSDKMATGVFNEGKKVRFLWGSKSVMWTLSGVSTRTWCTSLMIDLEAKTVTPDIYGPINYGPGAVWSGPTVMSPATYIGRFAGGGDNEVGEYISRGIQIGYLSSGSSVPQVGTYNVNDGSFTIDDFDATTRKVKNIGSSKHVVGNYGSPSEGYFYGLGFDAKNRLYFKQRADSTYVRCEYDPGGVYLGNYNTELGPTSVREYVGNSEYSYSKFSAIRVDKDGATAYGVVLGRGQMSNRLDPDDSSTEYTLLTDVHDSTIVDIIATSGVANDHDRCLTMMVSLDPEVPSVVRLQSMESKADGTGLYYAINTVYEADISINASKEITSVVLGTKIGTSKYNSNARSINSINDDVNSSGVADISDNRLAFAFMAAGSTSYVGWKGVFGDYMVYDRSAKTWSGYKSWYYYTIREACGLIPVPYVGLCTVLSDDSSTAIIGTVNTPVVGGPEAGSAVLIHSSQVKTGWQVYFTQEINFFINSTSFTMPVSEIDLKLTFPATYASNTFYLYAIIEGGTARYTAYEQYVADSDTTLFIGNVTTDENGITSLTVDRATRLGDFREFNEHLNDPTPHGLNLAKVTTDELGLGLLENKAIRNDLIIPTFKEVFNDWTRISHGTDLVFPSKENELLTWTYDEDTDSIRNTTNSASYVGMVSNTTVGDYDFVTGVSSTNNDDDWIGVILAFVIDEHGYEHTISALCIGTNTRSGQFIIVYNKGQGSANGEAYVFSMNSAVDHGWKDIPERIITASRRGDVFTVSVTDYAGEEGTAGEFSFNVTDYEYLEKFRGAVRFGYSAASQPYSTWRNILRPDEDGKNYYASQKLYQDNFSWSKRIGVVSGEVLREPATPDELLRFYVPIPEEYRGYNVQVWAEYKYSRDTGGGLGGTIIEHDIEEEQVVIRSPRSISGGVGGLSGDTVLRYVLTFFTDPRMI